MDLKRRTRMLLLVVATLALAANARGTAKVPNIIGLTKDFMKEVAVAWGWEGWWPSFNKLTPLHLKVPPTNSTNTTQLAPDLSQCVPVTVPASAGHYIENCCQPYSPTIVDFKLPPPSETLRIRRPAHTVDADYIAKYRKAVELMRALPAIDPRSFNQQSIIHCAYCDGGYHQVGFPDREFQIHLSWLFFPWHRFYVYFHERILGKLIGDPTFALPFWNWDSPSGMQIPLMYTDPSSSLYNQLRDRKHQPPAIFDLDFHGEDDTSVGPAQLVERNLKTMYKVMVSNAKTNELFMGSPYRAGDGSSPGPGTAEMVPHSAVHWWTGDRSEPEWEDMGGLYSAAFDPVFYAHHSNIDRMWELWRGFGGKRRNFEDEDWLETAFLFYDENAQLVRVKIRDCLDAEKMRFTYQDVEIPWLTSRSPSSTPAKKAKIVGAEMKMRFPVTLEKKVVRAMVKRITSRDDEEEEEVLVVEGIEVDMDMYAKFHVYVNAPPEKEVILTPEASEFAGSFVSMPHRHRAGKGHRTIRTSLRLGISDLLKELEAEGDDSIVVTLVPRKGKVEIGGMSIDFIS